MRVRMPALDEKVAKMDKRLVGVIAQQNELPRVIQECVESQPVREL